MSEYLEILAFLAANPPHLKVERELHASLLEFLAKSLRGEQATLPDGRLGPRRRMNFN
jgi:hypothetical protein